MTDDKLQTLISDLAPLLGPKPMCRDCADDGPICPNRGMPCDLTYESLSAIATELLERRALQAKIRDGIEKLRGSQSPQFLEYNLAIDAALSVVDEAWQNAKREGKL